MSEININYTNLLFKAELNNLESYGGRFRSRLKMKSEMLFISSYSSS